MSLAAECPGCMMGEHAKHREDHGITPGLIGGTYCDCHGDCAERFQRGVEEFGAWFDSLEGHP